jgi:hypothetical protein
MYARVDADDASGVGKACRTVDDSGLMAKEFAAELGSIAGHSFSGSGS